MPRSNLGTSFAQFVLLIFLAAPAFPLANMLAKQGSGTSVSDINLALRESRSSPLDLEVAGDLRGLPSESVRYLTRSDLLRLPQVSAAVTGDANFRGPTQISGVPLESLVQNLSAKPQSDLVVAICDDKYQANYTRPYIAAHHPILVLNINSQPPEGWPKDPDGQALSMGPYLISHANFTPSFKILSHADEPQIPWGVIRLEFRNEEKVLGSIAPRGTHSKDVDVEAGYRIAEQNCFRCHNMGDEGGQKAQRSWLVLATWAAASPDYFSGYIHDPKSKNPKAQMPGFPHYDAATLKALTAYFGTFHPEGK
jgi:mono/diheme cytochrome c family protein